MTERVFTILRSVDKVPVMASCAKCQLKFFAPQTYHNDPFGAEFYLRKKFEEHNCSVEHFNKRKGEPSLGKGRHPFT